MDPATQQRIKQVTAWCTRQLDEFAAIHDRIRAAVWEDGRFKDGLEDERAFTTWALAFQKTVPQGVYLGFVVEGDMRDYILISEMINEEGSKMELKFSYAWCVSSGVSNSAVWSENDVAELCIGTRRFTVDMGVQTVPNWRRGIPSGPAHCWRRSYVPDVGPLREAEVVPIVAEVLSTGMASLVETSLNTATKMVLPGGVL